MTNRRPRDTWLFAVWGVRDPMGSYVLLCILAPAIPACSQGVCVWGTVCLEQALGSFLGLHAPEQGLCAHRDGSCCLSGPL